MKKDPLLSEFEKFGDFEIKRGLLTQIVGGCCTNDQTCYTSPGFGTTPPDQDQEDCETDEQ